MKGVYLKTYKIKEIECRKNDRPISSIRSQGMYDNEELLSEVCQIVAFIFAVPEKRFFDFFQEVIYSRRYAINNFGYRYTHGLLLNPVVKKVLDLKYCKK